jgi:hypothetical protein
LQYIFKLLNIFNINIDIDIDKFKIILLIIAIKDPSLLKKLLKKKININIIKGKKIKIFDKSSILNRTIENLFIII